MVTEYNMKRWTVILLVVIITYLTTSFAMASDAAGVPGGNSAAGQRPQTGVVLSANGT